jgi:pyrimidine-nucleoside phosphorylase
MVASGDRLNFGDWPKPRVDKHSTGGVGDKTSLILVPLVASCGVAVPMISGAGLGHTGGTVDKMESIPGFRTALTLREADAQVRRIGAAMLRQTAEIAPADGKLYALRDVTATVESVPLIAASIMSKKLAEGLGGLVLDVKTGSGAFLPEVPRALELAGMMIALGEASGCRTVALLTAMDRPLGRACGNALEVEEALQALEGKGPDDLMTLTLALAIEMLLLAGVVKTAAEARAELGKAIDSGRALETFGRLIEAQGGDPKIVEDPSRLPQAGAVEVFTAPRTGVITRVEPRIVGRAVVALGGGRSRLEDIIDPAVGFVISARPGDRVTLGEPIASVFARDDAGATAGLEALSRAIVIEDEGAVVRLRPLISHRITTAGVREIVT